MRANDTTCTAFETAGIIERDLPVFDCIKACRTSKGTGFGFAPGTDCLINDDVSLVIINSKFIETQ